MAILANRKNIMAEANNYPQPLKKIILNFCEACQMINLKSDKFKVASVRIQYTNQISQEIVFSITCISHFYNGWRIENYFDFLSIQEKRHDLMTFDNKDYLINSTIQGWYVGVKFNYVEKTIEISDFFKENFPKKFRTIIENYMLYIR